MDKSIKITTLQKIKIKVKFIWHVMIFLLISNVFKRITERIILPQVKLNHSQSDKVGVKEMEPQDFNELHAF